MVAISAFKYVVGVDFGGTQLRAVLADGQGQFLRRTARPTEAQQGREHVLNNIEALIEEVVSEVERGQVAGVGLGAPAPLNAETGVIYLATGLSEWGNFPLRDVLTARLNLPLAIGNDANLAALGEYQFGAGKSYNHLVYVTISTGVGAGVVESGQIVLGANGLAAELGHLTVDVNGRLCPCGNIGCMAMYVCGGAIKHIAIEKLEVGGESLLREKCGGDLGQISAAMVAEAAREGDAFAIRHLRDTGRYLGAGITNILHLFNPEIVVIGGGVAQIGDLLFKPMQEWLVASAMRALQVPVLATTLGDDVGLYGAVALALKKFGL